MDSLLRKTLRQNVFNKMVDNSVAVLNAGRRFHRNGDTEYPFRQNSYFYYLTGVNESHALAIFCKKHGSQQFILCCQENDPAAEQWTGKRLGLMGAKALGADDAFSIQDAYQKMPELLANVDSVYFLINNDVEWDKQLFLWVDSVRKKARQGINPPHQFLDLRLILDEMRLIKTKEEIALMSKAAQISSQAHLKAMQHCQVGMNEGELEAMLLYEFYRLGSHAVAYPSIVGAGNNACILHYTQNNCVIRNNQLVLIDAGAEYENYASDVTRTFPANGKFTKEQEAIYELVLNAQMSAIEIIKPNLPWASLQETIIKVLVQGLIDLNILKGDLSTLIEEKAYLPFYMHNSGHWLGLDVHDVGEYKINGQWRPLVPGMVFTVEPGLYLSEDNAQIAEKWRGIGVRIEDDIVVTQEGYDILTKDVIKTPSEIEKWMRDG